MTDGGGRSEGDLKIGDPARRVSVVLQNGVKDDSVIVPKQGDFNVLISGGRERWSHAELICKDSAEDAAMIVLIDALDREC